jgi:hypothetical protein
MGSQVSISEEEIIREIHSIPDEYWPNLLEIVRIFRESVTLNPAESSFRRGWQEARRGQTRPSAELWENIDAG